MGVYTTQTLVIRQESSLGPVVILMRTGLFESPNAQAERPASRRPAQACCYAAFRTGPSAHSFRRLERAQSLDNLVSPQQHRRRNREPECLRGLE
jgi:hypothetical protein